MAVGTPGSDVHTDNLLAEPTDGNQCIISSQPTPTCQALPSGHDGLKKGLQARERTLKPSLRRIRQIQTMTMWEEALSCHLPVVFRLFLA